MIFLTDKNITASLIDYSRIKSRRVVRSSLGAITFGMADASIVLKHDIKKITAHDLNIKVLTDGETLFNVIVQNASTTER